MNDFAEDEIKPHKNCGNCTGRYSTFRSLTIAWTLCPKCNSDVFFGVKDNESYERKTKDE